MGTVESPVKQPKLREKVAKSPPWRVLVLDDPVNLMGYVSRVLMRIFGYPREKADRLMLMVHQQGRAVVWVGDREKAEMYVQQLHEAQLRAKLERAE